jgi:mannose/cellobiose epimerase-like protein (N-acyl-D-glucosamine 2-epimerase family)
MKPKVITNIFLILLSSYTVMLAQYQVKSEYLLHPEKNIEYIINEADYWKQFYDSTYGGFFSFIDGEGNVTDENTKALCPQSRLAYSYARAFMVTGNEEYLKYAHYAAKFLYKHGWDKENGGWFFTTDREGNITDSKWDRYNKEIKQAFQQHYALLGPAAICDATGGRINWSEFINNPNENSELTDWDWVMRGYNSLMNNMWDGRPNYEGHYYIADYDWANPKNKGFTPTGDAMTTNAVILYLLTKDENIKNRMLTIADNISDRLVKSRDDADVKLGFAEEYDSDWVINQKRHKHLLGHVYKAAWVLGRAYLIEPQEKYRTAAEMLLNDMWNNGGYDKVYGGVYKKYDWASGEIIDSSKNHWTLEQGVTSGLINYYIADNPQFKDIALQIADESICFYMENIRDYQNGGSFSETDRTGTKVTDYTKGNVYGANYHGVEMSYFAYLYGSLFLKDTTVTLYYYFPATDSERTISLFPLAYYDDKLIIDEVALNDTSFTSFNRDTRVLNIASGIGGKFKVTYKEKDEPNSVANKTEVISGFVLRQNYPNPFNPTTVISFTIPQDGNVKLTIYNSLGQLIKVLVDKKIHAGKHEYHFNANGLSGGVYFYRLSSDKFSSVRKMIFIK